MGLNYRRVEGEGGGFAAWVRELRGTRSGVYVIRSASSHRTWYVGESHSGRLYDTLTRHFQRWSGRTAGVRYDRGDVEVAVVVTPAARAPEAQARLICRLDPRDNTNSRCNQDVPF